MNNAHEIPKEWWASVLPLPLRPSEKDVEIYKSLKLPGKTLLLGNTRDLLHISDVWMDQDPHYDSKYAVKQDWATNTDRYTNILADGSLTFSKELCEELIIMSSKYSKRLIARSFNRPLNVMKLVGGYYPTPEEHIIPPTITQSFDDYYFYVWDFNQNG